MALRSKLGLEDAFILGFVGSFYAYEGLDLLLQALRLLRHHFAVEERRSEGERADRRAQLVAGHPVELFDPLVALRYE